MVFINISLSVALSLTTMRTLIFVCTHVNTKYGEVVIHINDVVTYLGNDLWDIRNETR